MVKRKKKKTITTKHQKFKRKISFFIKKKEMIKVKLTIK